MSIPSAIILLSKIFPAICILIRTINQTKPNGLLITINFEIRVTRLIPFSKLAKTWIIKVGLYYRSMENFSSKTFLTFHFVEVIKSDKFSKCRLKSYHLFFRKSSKFVFKFNFLKN